MDLDIPLLKIFRKPLISVQESWVDAFPVLIFFVLFGASVIFFLFLKKKWIARRSIQIIAFFIFVFLIHRCLCVVRGWIYGLVEIGRDDLRAFEHLCMFIPILGLSIFFGRIFCGWICPLGFVQELAGRMNTRKGNRNIFSLILFIVLIAVSVVYFYYFRPGTDFFTENVAAVWSVVLIVLLIYLWFNPSFPAVKIKIISFAAWTLLGIVGVFITNPWCILYGNELDYSALLAFFNVIVIASVHSQAWCRYMCPLGGLLSLLSKYGLIQLKLTYCDDCYKKDCFSICPTGAIKNGKLRMPECILCGKCIEKCRGNIY
jgi:polyferredoxin